MNPLRWLEPAMLALALTASDGPRPQSGPAAEREAYARHALSNSGDAARGLAVFEDEKGAGCVRCHRVRGRGGTIGPDLSSIGGKYAREHLIESVLEPSRQIVEGYRSTILELDDGRVLTGLIKAETADRLTLVDAEAREQAIAKKAISGRKFADVSIMPEGLASGLTRPQFADLIAYLQGLRERRSADARQRDRRPGHPPARVLDGQGRRRFDRGYRDGRRPRRPGLRLRADRHPAA